MDTSKEMVSVSFKASIKYGNDFYSIGAEAAIHIQKEETIGQAFERAWKEAQSTVDKQVLDSINSIKQNETTKAAQ